MIDSKSRLSIIIPCLNEGELLKQCLLELQPLRSEGHELILVDGGSDKPSISQLDAYLDHFVKTTPGRAHQMNQGAAKATGDILWFLHADSQIGTGLEKNIIHAASKGPVWGRFDVRLSGAHPMLRIVEWMMNRRSCLSGLATGDQAIFIHRDFFSKVGGFPLQPLMEDIEISRRLKRIATPICLQEKIVTSSRRWESKGIVRTILLMWMLRLGYWLGVSPDSLAKHYSHNPRNGS
ncbi:MAG: TIGR04283 family arsenosugar biosynthesis glycosyltransferase [Candidatus Thiodiazotropha sp. (ex Lucinoma annulata)]|nr:TIGR04283 family arsenosugar biosynthesis glycosyltransferase [Candidatus Thiodiazotropha sp. (ex Lucinoma annulata)]